MCSDGLLQSLENRHAVGGEDAQLRVPLRRRLAEHVAQKEPIDGRREGPRADELPARRAACGGGGAVDEQRTGVRADEQLGASVAVDVEQLAAHHYVLRQASIEHARFGVTRIKLIGTRQQFAVFQSALQYIAIVTANNGFLFSFQKKNKEYFTCKQLRNPAPTKRAKTRWLATAAFVVSKERHAQMPTCDACIVLRQARQTNGRC